MGATSLFRQNMHVLKKKTVNSLNKLFFKALHYSKFSLTPLSNNYVVCKKKLSDAFSNLAFNSFTFVEKKCQFFYRYIDEYVLLRWSSLSLPIYIYNAVDHFTSKYQTKNIHNHFSNGLSKK